MILMHKNDPVAEVNAENGLVLTYKKMINPELAPVGTTPAHNFLQPSYLQSWHQSRSIPNGRQGIDAIQRVTGTTVGDGFLKSLGVSLTDTYWLKEEGSSLSWQDVNFYENGFEPVFAKALENIRSASDISPDYTTDGMMKKFWVLSAGIPYLSKIDSLHSNAETANEVIVSTFAVNLGINAVPYNFGRIGDFVICSCPCFVDNPDTDYVSALQVQHAVGKKGITLASYFDNELGLKEALDNLRFVDVLFHQEDRHEKNLGITYKNGRATLAPIFDSGSCLGISRSPVTKSSSDNLKFFNKPREMVALDIDNVPNFSEKFLFDLLKNTYEQFKVPEERYEYALEELSKGVELVNRARETNRDEIDR